ncbi:MAG: hypothetical protein C0482_06590 [Gordonia sp.]|nr:hypothetical protein [Gordonia sp. (in: high G+C Gram-positive bacteria)]
MCKCQTRSNCSRQLRCGGFRAVIRVLLFGIVLVLISGCDASDPSTQAVAQSDSAGRSGNLAPTTSTSIALPFENRFTDRWNSSNDGTTYEPCVAFSDEELLRFDVDPTEVEDAAQVNGQGSRGCNWTMPDAFGLGQVVTDSGSLVDYRRGTPELNWMPDIAEGGRTIGVFGLNGDPSTCSTYVQSQYSGVVTNVSISSDPKARAKLNACSIAIDFTRAYIDKIPE